jgi:hypothetical protein
VRDPYGLVAVCAEAMLGAMANAPKKEQKKIEKKNTHKVLSFQIKEEKSERKKAKPKLVRH